MSLSSSPHPHEQGTSPQTVDGAAWEGCFTVEEVAQLCALRQYFQAHSDHGDADAAIRRLEFARWLVQHGKLTDGCAQQSGPRDDQYVQRVLRVQCPDCGDRSAGGDRRGPHV